MSDRKYGFFLNGAYAPVAQDEAFAILSDLGYSYAEIGWTPRSGKVSDLIKSVKNAADAGLGISEAVVQLDYVVKDAALRERNIADTLVSIDAAAEAGIGTVNLFTGPIPWGESPITAGRDISEGDAWKIILDAFGRFVPAAEKAGVDIAVENVWGHLCRDFFTAQYLVNRFGSPNLGVNFDPSHDRLAGLTDMRFLINGWGKSRIKHIHLKDAAGIQENGRFIFPMLGEGLVDWNGVRAGLDDIGYDGPLSVEWESGANRVYFDGDFRKTAASAIMGAKKLLG